MALKTVEEQLVEEERMVVAAQQYVRDHGDESDSDGRLLAYYVETLVGRLNRLRESDAT